MCERKIKYKIFNIVKVILITCVVVGLYSCGVVNSKNTTVKGLIWQISKNGKINNIVGTMHPMPQNYEHLNKDIIDILNKAEGVAVQLDITNPTNTSSLHNQRLLDKGDSMENYLTKEEIDILEKIFNTFDREVDMNGVKSLNPKGIYNMLMNLHYLETGFISSSNESEIILAAKLKGIPLVELLGLKNTNKFLDELFTWDSLKNYINHYFNREVLDKQDYAEKIFTAYAEGDLEALVQYEKEIQLDNGQEREYIKLFTSTNIDITENIDKLASEKENYIFALDYRRLISDNNILLALKRKGYTIKRI